MVTGDSERFGTSAREDAFYFVDNRLRYGDPDVELFWTQGGATSTRSSSS